MVFSKLTYLLEVATDNMKSVILYAAIVGYAAYHVYYRWSRSRRVSQARMEGKVVIITGGTTGVGYEAARELAKRGARVVLTGRDLRRGLAAKERIVKETRNPDICFRHLDLQSFASVRNFVFEIMNNEDRLDVLINNASTASASEITTLENLPKVQHINHFGPFMLTMLLVELLKISRPSRIINVTSVAHRFGKVNPMTFEKPIRTYWARRKMYCDTKVANILFAHKLNMFLQGSGVTVNCVEPGYVYASYFWRLPMIVRLLLRLVLFSPADGAEGIVHLAVAPELETTTGRLFRGCKEVQPKPAAVDTLTAERLWRVSERVVGFRDYDHNS